MIQALMQRSRKLSTITWSLLKVFNEDAN